MAAGWYPEPGKPDSKRYWDGRAWTDAPPKSKPSFAIPFLRKRGGRLRIVRLVILAIVVIAGIVSLVSRHTTKLDNSVPGTQQQWVDYVNKADPAVQVLNKSNASTPSILSALATIATSPDPALNSAAQHAIKDCKGGETKACDADFRVVADHYNSALDHASKEGLVTISSTQPTP